MATLGRPKIYEGNERKRINSLNKEVDIIAERMGNKRRRKTPHVFCKLSPYWQNEFNKLFNKWL